MNTGWVSSYKTFSCWHHVQCTRWHHVDTWTNVSLFIGLLAQNSTWSHSVRSWESDHAEIIVNYTKLYCMSLCLTSWRSVYVDGHFLLETVSPSMERTVSASTVSSQCLLLPKTSVLPAVSHTMFLHCLCTLDSKPVFLQWSCYLLLYLLPFLHDSSLLRKAEAAPNSEHKFLERTFFIFLQLHTHSLAHSLLIV